MGPACLQQGGDPFLHEKASIRLQDGVQRDLQSKKGKCRMGAKVIAVPILTGLDCSAVSPQLLCLLPMHCSVPADVLRETLALTALQKKTCMSAGRGGPGFDGSCPSSASGEVANRHWETIRPVQHSPINTQIFLLKLV